MDSHFKGNQVSMSNLSPSEAARRKKADAAVIILWAEDKAINIW